MKHQFKKGQVVFIPSTGEYLPWEPDLDKYAVPLKPHEISGEPISRAELSDCIREFDECLERLNNLLEGE